MRDGAEPPTRTDLQEILERRGPRRHRARVEEVLWASEFRIAHRIADRFRLGRAFLAGDAAHVHSPAGGQGMNTGLQDAVNLAWKLALAVRGEGGEELLDSYELERRPVAAQVVRQTDRLTRMATTRSPLTQHARNVALLAAGRVPAVRRRIARDLSQLSVAYRPAWGRLPGGGRRWSGVVPPADAQGPRLHAVVPAVGRAERGRLDAGGRRRAERRRRVGRRAASRRLRGRRDGARGAARAARRRHRGARRRPLRLAATTARRAAAATTAGQAHDFRADRTPSARIPRKWAPPAWRE